MPKFEIRHKYDEDEGEITFIDTVKGEMKSKNELFDWFKAHAKKYQVFLCKKCMQRDYEKDKTLNNEEWERYIITKRKNLVAITEERETNRNSIHFGKIVEINIDFVCPKCGRALTVSNTPIKLFNEYRQLFSWAYELSKYQVTDFSERFEKILKEQFKGEKK